MNATTSSTGRHRALIIANNGLMTARIMGAWLACGHEIAALWIGPVKKRRFLLKNWEISLLRPRWSVAALSARHSIPVRPQPKLSRWAGALEEVRATGADVLITSATMQIVPRSILALFPGRGFNFHPALLPHYRGPSPRQGMVLDGAHGDYAGVTCHMLNPGIDEGDIVAQRCIPIDPGALYHAWDIAVASAAADITGNEMQQVLQGTLVPRPQELDRGNYRRVAQTELTITPRTTVEQARRLCDMLGDSGGIIVDAPGARRGHCKVDRFVREEGPATGQPLHVRPSRLTLDVLDRRITLRRRTAATRRLRRLALLRALHAHDREERRGYDGS